MSKETKKSKEQTYREESVSLMQDLYSLFYKTQNHLEMPSSKLLKENLEKKMTELQTKYNL